jgi:hypothetical protein
MNGWMTAVTDVRAAENHAAVQTSVMELSKFANLTLRGGRSGRASDKGLGSYPTFDGRDNTGKAGGGSPGG